MTRTPSARIVVVGGGLAGMAAATALADRGREVVLLEAKRWLGGRAGSFEDPASGETVDLCQHVALGCCTNFLAFCEQTGIAPFFRRDRELHFFSFDGRRSDFAASPWLPAPLHLAPALVRLSFLSRAARWAIASSMRALAKAPATPDVTVLSWLRQQRQPEEAIERFWSVVLVSALGETLDRASLAAARKVFVDGFISHRDAGHMLVPARPLLELFEQHVAPHLARRGVTLRKSTPAVRLLDDGQRINGVELSGGEHLPADHTILAVPWRPAARLVQGTLAEELAGPWQPIESSPITGVHLWFDRRITELSHAVLVGRLSQWLFARAPQVAEGEAYYQVVISASRALTGRSAANVTADVVGDLEAIFPAARRARLVRSRVVTQPEAVFSVTPELEALRPPQATAIPGLSLAGDWTATGWSATLEGAVRSGYQAAEAALQAMGQSATCVVPDLPRSLLARLLF